MAHGDVTIMRKREYPPRRIPKAKLDKGIVLCVDNARRYIGSAASIANSGNVIEAAALLSIGVEEYGKAVWLKEYRNHTEDPIIVDGAIFEDHEQKLKKAAENLPKGVLTIRSAAFQSNAFQSNSFDTQDTTLNLATRLNQLYVNWVEEKGDWSKMTHAEVGKIQQCVKIVSEHLAKLKEEIKHN